MLIVFHCPPMLQVPNKNTDILSYVNTVSQIPWKQADIGTTANCCWLSWNCCRLLSCQCLGKIWCDMIHKFLVRNLHNLRARCSSYFTDLTNSPVYNIQHEIHTLETVGMLYASFDMLGRFKVFTGVSCSRGWSCESIKKEIISVLHCCYL